MSNTATGAIVRDSYYFYDANGIISSARIYVYNGSVATEYNLLFRTNIQGDVCEILNFDGTSIMSIYYDAWGNFEEEINTSNTQLAALAYEVPFRYRSYYYDSEINMYYLNTRYYDAKMYRFINADEVSYLGANGDLQAFNLYAYCSNNPVMGCDPMGMWTISFGFNANVTFLLGVSVSIGFSFDDDGNVAVQISNGGNVGVAAVGAGVYFGGTSADTVSDLNDLSMSFGATVGSGLYGGMDLIELNDGDEEFDGGQILIGYGAGTDIHGGVNYTETIWQDTWEGIGGWIKEKWEWISGLFD